jgi:hypothetical protein
MLYPLSYVRAGFKEYLTNTAAEHRSLSSLD